MREITDRLFQLGSEHDLGVGWSYILVGSDGLILFDPGYGWHYKPGNQYVNSLPGAIKRDEALVTPQLEELIEFSISLDKPIKYGILSHSHADHASNMELLINKAAEINSYVGKKVVELSLIVHENSALQENVILHISKKMEMVIAENKITFIPTPGHSERMDDMSIWLNDKKILLCGDLCQPQGRDYHICNGLSPIPFFVDGDKTKKSLEKLLEFDFDLLMTAHGYQYNKQNGIKALKLTHSLLEKIEELVVRLIKENPEESEDTIALWVYDTITYERKFDREKAEFRKYHYDRNGISDFQRYDKVIIDYFIKKHKC